MLKFNSKIKIILVLVAFVGFAILMFTFGYGILGSSNQAIADSVIKRRLELDILQREQKNFEQGKKDLATLESATYPPSDLFSSDTKLVKEIQQLEAAAGVYGLKLQISISGTTKTASKVPGSEGELYAVPYTMTVIGSFSNTMQFLQAIEHLPFVTHVKTIGTNVGLKDESTTVFTSQFFIKK